MTFFFDITPFVIIAVIIGLAIITAIIYALYSLAEYCIFIPLKHKITGLKLYQFERQVYNNRIVKKLWLKNDSEAKHYQCCHNFYSFCTKEIHPKPRHLEEL